MRNTERLYDRVIEKMDMTCDMEDEELQELIHEVLEEASKEEFIPLQEKIRISKELFNAFRKLDAMTSELVIQPLDNNRFHYISNQVIKSNLDDTSKWYRNRLTYGEWNKIYKENDEIK